MTPRIIWLASYPKSGNTWLRIFLANLLDGGSAPLDVNDLLSNGSSYSRQMFDDTLGFDTGDLLPEEYARLRPAVYRWVNAQLSADVYLKTHDACIQIDDGDWAMAPDATRKVVYIMRNPLDVAISWAHHSSISIDASIKALGRQKTVLAKHKPTGQRETIEQPMGTWSEHVKSWTENPYFDTCVIRYEDMAMKPEHTFTQIVRFLGLPHEAQQINQAICNASFDVLREKETETGFREKPSRVDRFFRKGKVGDWQEMLSPEEIEQTLRDHGPVMQKFGYLGQDGRPQLA